MLNEQKIKDFVEIVDGLGYNCMVGGSSVYLDNGTASDIDVYVDFRNRPLEKFEEDLLDQLTLEGDFILQEKKRKTPSAYVQGCDYIKNEVNLKDEEGTVFNVIATDIQHDNGFALAVLGTFDYGRIQIGYTKDGLINTDAYEKDVQDQTLTLINVWSKYHLGIMGQRIEKMQNRFPGHRIVITKDFYHETPKKRVYKNQYTKTPTSFMAQVAAAREFIQRVEVIG